MVADADSAIDNDELNSDASNALATRALFRVAGWNPGGPSNNNNNKFYPTLLATRDLILLPATGNSRNRGHMIRSRHVIV